MSAAGSHGDAAPIGLLGGTFDPIHVGHLRIAIEACEQLGLDHVRLVPLNRPNHRAPAQASAAARADLIRAALADACHADKKPAGSALELDESELERGGVSYTVDTLAMMRERFGTRPLCLLLGHDAYLTLPAWHQPERLLALAHIVVIARPNAPTAGSPALDELIGNAQSEQVSDLHQSAAGRVLFFSPPPLAISSSDIRARLARGDDVRYLVPDPVRARIAERGLYRP